MPTGKSFSPAMSENIDLLINDQWIVSSRGKKNNVDSQKPYGWLVEKERTLSGSIEDTGIIFLTNMECTFHCLMCDLWKNTTDDPVSPGTIPMQIRYALEKMPGVRHIKLYNSGSFFDNRAIPEEDYEEIAELLRDLETVIVECHPRLINEKCLRFRDMLVPELHVAMGLETVNPDILKMLNKHMTPDDFSNAVHFLAKNEIPSRAFILLRPPLLSESEGVYWAERSIDFAFNSGAECCTIIPVRSGNGAMDELQKKGHFHPPDIRSLESVLEYGIQLNSGRVFADVWDLGLFSDCGKCLPGRTERITLMNLNQKIISPIECSCIS
jgi:radical SAM enzyme (TIGR01210 family)